MIWGETKMIFEPNVWLVQTICFYIPLKRSLNIILISLQIETFGGPGQRVSHGFKKDLAAQTILCSLGGENATNIWAYTQEIFPGCWDG